MDGSFKIDDRLIAAIVLYYVHRDQQNTRKWDKDADLKEIDRIRKEVGATSFQACAGTFWFTWETFQTCHNNDNIGGTITGRVV